MYKILLIILAVIALIFSSAYGILKFQKVDIFKFIFYSPFKKQLQRKIVKIK